MNHINYNQPDDYIVSATIGAFVLESLTVGMYNDASDVLRAYIQNSMDSLNEAVATNLISEQEKEIKFKLSNEENSISIVDNGAGIPVKIAPQILLSIGRSEKSFGKNTGFRGIGRLAGIGFCDELTFETSAKDNQQMCRVSFNCKNIRASFDPKKHF